MKTIFTFLFTLLISAMSFGQSFFIHTATAENTSADASYIDHPDLNNNPDAQLLISHVWNPPGSNGVYNDNVSGVFYSNAQNKWGVYNESAASIIEGSSYTVYIDQGSDITLHIADLANQGGEDVYSVINHPELNNNPDAHIILTTYYNPNETRNDFNHSVWYNATDERWTIFNEELATIPLNAAFFVGVQGTETQSTTHAANVENISGNFTLIDHPLLNDNPDAIFVFTHNWGVSGNTSNVVLNKTLGMWYTGSQWSIYTEDQSAMPEGIEFDLMILDPSLGVTDSVFEEFNLFPNPTKNHLNISSKVEISNISIYNLLGQEIISYIGGNELMNLDVSELTSGTYIVKVKAGDTESSKKFIKI